MLILFVIFSAEGFISIILFVFLSTVNNFPGHSHNKFV